MDTLIGVTVTHMFAHFRTALRVVGETTATLFTWCYLVLVVSLVRWELVTPPEVCGTASGGAFMAVLLLGVVLAVIVRRDERLAGAGKLWAPLQWLRLVPATVAICVLVAGWMFSLLLG
ncbi:MAG: hypothetical protein WBB42_13045 [Polyangiales bacterium]